MPSYDLRRRVVAEGLGTPLLASIVVGSGIMAERVAAFSAADLYIKNGAVVFTSLALASIDKLGLGARLRAMGQAEAATSSLLEAS